MANYTLLKKKDKATRSQVRNMTKEQLKEIISDAENQDTKLVKECRHEIGVRRESMKYKEQVAAFDINQIEEVLTNPDKHEEALVYRCQKELDKREKQYRLEKKKAALVEKAKQKKEVETSSSEEVNVVEEKEETEGAEEAEATENEEDEEKQLRKEELVSKIWKIALPIVAIGLIVWGVFYLCSDTYKYHSAVDLREDGKIEKAIEKFSKIEESHKFYMPAQVNLYYCYCANGDSVSAAKALLSAFDHNPNLDIREYVDLNSYSTNGNLSKKYAKEELLRREEIVPYYSIEVNDLYASHLIKGDLFPYIQPDTLKAAEIYENTPFDRLTAGILYFSRGSFAKARILLKEFPDDPKAQGYMGIMYRFGLGGCSIDLEEAYNCLEKAPNLSPFAVHKGDLMLYLRKEGSYNARLMESMKAARVNYNNAVAFDRDNDSYAIRLGIVQKVLEAWNKSDNADFWNNDPVYWTSYRWGENREHEYIGEVSMKGWSEGANGWGCYRWNNGSLKISKYNWLKANGLTVYFMSQSNGFAMFVGEMKDDRPVRGSYMYATGNTEIGEFNEDWSLKEGVLVDVLGRKIKDIK